MSTTVSYRAREHISSLLEMLSAEAASLSTTASPSSKGGASFYKNGMSSSGSISSASFVSVVHASEMKGDTIPLSAEVREEVVEVVPAREGGEEELADGNRVVAMKGVATKGRRRGRIRGKDKPSRGIGDEAPVDFADTRPFAEAFDDDEEEDEEEDEGDDVDNINGWAVGQEGSGESEGEEGEVDEAVISNFKSNKFGVYEL